MCTASYAFNVIVLKTGNKVVSLASTHHLAEAEAEAVESV